MGTISLQIPQSNLPNLTEDPKVANNFTTLQTWANGNVDTNNLSPSAAVKLTQLAAAVARYQIITTTTNTTAADGQLIFAYGPPQTITLPVAPAAGAQVAVMAANASGSAQVTITGPANTIFGTGATGVTSILLGTSGAAVVLVWDGVRWQIVSGQQDTGWANLSLNAGWANQGALACGYRLIGDRVWLRGSAVGGASTGVVAVLPAGYRPTSQIYYPAVSNTQVVKGGTIDTTGNINGAGTGSGADVSYLNGLSFGL